MVDSVCQMAYSIYKKLTKTSTHTTHRGHEMKTLNYEVRENNGQCAFGEFMDRADLPADHRDWIDTAVIEGDIEDGGTITVEGGQRYTVYLPE
jgi:hypothetical protein